MLGRFLLRLIWLYQKLISPLLSARCRYYPTCSCYGRQALLWHGSYRGLLLLLRRLVYCQPWGGSGVDFVPVPMYLYTYCQVSGAVRHGAAGVWVDECSYVARLNHLMRTT